MTNYRYKESWEKIEKARRKKFVNQLSQIFSVSKDQVQRALSMHRGKTIRVNTLRGDEKEIIKSLEDQNFRFEKIPWISHAYYLAENDTLISKTDEFQKGLIYMGNASSLVPVKVLDPQAGEYILDGCAAPGGKTTHVAEATNNKAKIWANEIDEHRFKILKDICHKYSADVYKFTNKDLNNLKTQGDKFEKILLDPQCSAEGLINFNRTSAMKLWQYSRVKKFQKEQKELIVSAFEMLKKGGTLVYSTCTFTPEENEIVVDYLCNKFKNARISPIDLQLPNFYKGLTSWQGNSLNNYLKNTIRIFPNRFMEGFYVAKIVKG